MIVILSDRSKRQPATERDDGIKQLKKGFLSGGKSLGPDVAAAAAAASTATSIKKMAPTTTNADDIDPNAFREQYYRACRLCLNAGRRLVSLCSDA